MNIVYNTYYLFIITYSCRLKQRYHYFITCIKSLTYNTHLSQSYVSDICIEPLIKFVDNFTHLLGPFFVIGVICLTTAVVYICYWIGLPYWWNKSPVITVFLLIIGNWLLVNVVFHYYMVRIKNYFVIPY